MEMEDYALKKIRVDIYIRNNSTRDVIGKMLTCLFLLMEIGMVDTQ